MGFLIKIVQTFITGRLLCLQKAVITALIKIVTVTHTSNNIVVD